MFELEEILVAIGRIWWFIALVLSIFSVLIIMGYRVRVHEKVLFDEKGIPRFVSKEETFVHLAAQAVKNAELEAKSRSSKHEECPLHHELGQGQIDMRLQQRVNMERLNGLTESMAESKELREVMNNKLTAICLNTNTLLTKQQDILEDIRELKERRIETRI